MTALASELTAAVHQVGPAASRDPKHPASLRCVLVERVGNVARVVATDKHRLAVWEGEGDIVPPGTRLLIDPATFAEVDIVDDFPEYERFLAGADVEQRASIDPAALLDAVETATDDDRPLAVQLADGEVRLGADATTPELYVEASYLHDALVAAGAGEAVLETSGPLAPLAVRGADVVTLVMPVRIAN